jgi:hypothetical protein
MQARSVAPSAASQPGGDPLIGSNGAVRVGHVAQGERDQRDDDDRVEDDRAKYLAMSLAIENMVNVPCVINSCLPISTISISLVGSESRSTMLPGLFGGRGTGVHGHADLATSAALSR